MAFNNELDATKAAAELVKAALSSNAIKLSPGGYNGVESAGKNAKADATYLSALIRELAKELQTS